MENNSTQLLQHIVWDLGLLHNRNPVSYSVAFIPKEAQMSLSLLGRQICERIVQI